MTLSLTLSIVSAVIETALIIWLLLAVYKLQDRLEALEKNKDEWGVDDELKDYDA